jgi:hypothetical protein
MCTSWDYLQLFFRYHIRSLLGVLFRRKFSIMAIFDEMTGK